MSQTNKMDAVLKTLASNQASLGLYIDALKAMHDDEAAKQRSIAIAALFDPKLVPDGCASWGRCDMLHSLIVQAEHYVR